MTHHWDEFSRSLAEKSVPRRQSLRQLGATLAGALLGPLGAQTVWARRRDACREVREDDAHELAKANYDRLKENS